MNKFLLVSIISVIAIPSVLAEKGSGDMGKPLPPPPMPPMEQSGAKMNEGHHSEMKLPPMMGSGEVRPPMMNSGGTRPPMGEKNEVRREMMGSGVVRPFMGSGSVKPPMGSGATLEQEMKGLQLAIGKLTPEQRKELLKLIRDYLVSKGVNTGENGPKKPVMPIMKKMMENRNTKDGEKSGSGKFLPPPLPPVGTL